MHAVDLIGHGDTADRAFGDRAVICHHAVKRAAGDRAVICHHAVKRAAGDRAVVVDHLAVKDTVGDHLAVDHPAVKGTAADRARVLHRAVKRAAADDTSGIHTHGVRSTTAGRTAGDPHIAADLRSSAAVRNAAAICSIALIAVFCMAVPDLRRAGQIDGSFIIYAAAIRITSHRRAARNTAAGHGERAVAIHIHAAAPRLKGGGGRTAHDIAALHGELAAALHVHAAAVNRCPDAAARAAVDNTTLDGLCSVGFIQHPQAVSVGGELMLRIGSAVLDGQVYAVFHLNAGHFQHIAVQVDGKVGAHRHGTAVVDVVQQLETAASDQCRVNVLRHRCLCGGARRHRRRGHRQLRLSLYKFPRRLLRLPRLLLLLRVAGLFALPGLLRRVAGLFSLPDLLRLFDLRYRLPHGCVLRQCLHRQQRQRHDQSHQYAYDTSFHSPLLFLLTSPRSPARTSGERIFAAWHVYHHYAIQC